MKTINQKNIEVAVEIRNKMLSWNEVNKLLSTIQHIVNELIIER